MKAVLVHDWLNGMRGGEKVLEAMLEIFPEAPIHTLFYEPDRVSEAIRSRRIIPSSLQKMPLTRSHYRNYLPLYPRAVKGMDVGHPDLIFSISHCAAKAVPKPPGAVHVCYCLTPIRYIWDKYDVYFGNKSLLSPSRIFMSLLRKRLQEWDQETAKPVDFFIATSRYIAEKIRHYLGRECHIIHPHVDTEFYHPESDPKGDDYFLVVSALTPYKRVDLAVEAFRARKERLIIAGTGPEEKKLRQDAPDNVEFRGWVNDETLRELYRNCRALIFPPEEDFGIVPLEAMACGRPVIAFGSGGALETVKDEETGIFFEKQASGSLNEALERFQSMDFHREKIRKHALGFSRERFINETHDFLKDKAGWSC